MDIKENIRPIGRIIKEAVHASPAISGVSAGLIGGATFDLATGRYTMAAIFGTAGLVSASVVGSVSILERKARINRHNH